MANPGLRPTEAASCEHASLSDLRWFGPWQVQVEPDALVLTQQVPGWQAVAWGEWKEARVTGRRYRLATNLPDLHLMRLPRLVHLPCQEIPLACRRFIRVPAALADGTAFGVDGQPGELASPYAQALVALLDRSSRGETPEPADWIAVITQAIQAGYRLTDEAIAGMRLIGHTDIAAYLQAMTHTPKAGPADAG